MLCLWWLYLELGLVAAPELAGSAAPGEYKCTARGLAYGRAHGGRYRASITRKATGAERVNTRTPARTRGVHGHLASLRAPAGMTRAPPSRSTIDSALRSSVGNFARRKTRDDDELCHNRGCCAHRWSHGRRRRGGGRARHRPDSGGTEEAADQGSAHPTRATRRRCDTESVRGKS